MSLHSLRSGGACFSNNLLVELTPTKLHSLTTLLRHWVITTHTRRQRKRLLMARARAVKTYILYIRAEGSTVVTLAWCMRECVSDAKKSERARGAETLPWGWKDTVPPEHIVQVFTHDCPRQMEQIEHERASSQCWKQMPSNSLIVCNSLIFNAILFFLSCS